MRTSFAWVATLLVVGGAAWLSRDAPWARHLAGEWPGARTNATASPPEGVHKCRLPDGRVVYADRPCDRGAREQAMGGGTVTTVPALAPRRPPSAASAGLIQGFDPATVDRLREQQIDAAANR